MSKNKLLALGLSALLIACTPGNQEAEPAAPESEIEEAQPASPEYLEQADAVVARWTEALSGEFKQAAALEEQEFIPAWQAIHDKWAAELKALDNLNPPAKTADKYLARIKYEWAFGRFLYPAMHARATQNWQFKPSDTYDDYLNELEFDRADYLDLTEYTDFLDRVLNRDARDIFENKPESLTGEVRFLTAKLRTADTFKNQEVRCFLKGKIFDLWLEENETDGLADEPQAFQQDCPGEKAEATLAWVAENYKERDDHDVRVFKKVDDLELELHIWRPADWNEGDAPRPIVVFSHGGGWDFGSWQWCAGCSIYKERGYVVASVEYRLRGRHGTHAGQSLEDVMDAISYMRTHAEEFGGDPYRILSAGFSAGGHLSMAAGTFAEKDSSAAPNLVVSMSGCVDMAQDEYGRRMAGGEDKARAISPLYAPNADGPPMLLINAQYDHLCKYDLSQEFVSKLESGGGKVQFLGLPNEGHFFISKKESFAKAKEVIYSFLDENGF